MTSVRSTHLVVYVVLILATLALPGQSFAQVGVSITIAPPALPIYTQPICPGDGNLWTPGYWAWDDGDYYWVPGTWVLAPEAGFLWTPGYWGWACLLYTSQQPPPKPAPDPGISRIARDWRHSRDLIL